jgi:hypothetical protein
MTVPYPTRCPGSAAAVVALLLPLAGHAYDDHHFLRAAAPQGAIEHRAS